jgi:hypothetical protein
VHSLKADKGDEKPRHTEGCNRRWKHQKEVARVCKIFGGNMMERYTDVKADIERLLRYSEAL